MSERSKPLSIFFRIGGRYIIAFFCAPPRADGVRSLSCALSVDLEPHVDDGAEHLLPCQQHKQHARGPTPRAHLRVHTTQRRRRGKCTGTLAARRRRGLCRLERSEGHPYMAPHPPPRAVDYCVGSPLPIRRKMRRHWLATKQLAPR